MENILRIKLYGEAFKIHKIKIDSKILPKFEYTALKLKEPLHIAILNVDFFRTLNLCDFQGLNDIIESTINSLINNNKNQVEINFGRKRIAKFKIDELFRQRTLFPLYNVQINTDINNNLVKGLYLVEKEIGLVGSFEKKVENLKIDLVKFHLSKMDLLNENHELLNKIEYDGKSLRLLKSDSLLRSRNCFLKE